MARWIRFEHAGRQGFGELKAGPPGAGDTVAVHDGDLFGDHTPTGETLALDDLRLRLPCTPSKFIGLWNNDHAQAAKQGLAIPATPLWFLKPPSSHHPHGEPILPPAGYAGRVVYEGELGLVIGQRCHRLTPEQASAAIFGVTCVNDVTAIDTISADASFAQWARAKGADTFGVFGPVIATGLDISTLRVVTRVNGRERQNFACADMIFSPAQIVSALSQDMTLCPGDLIACGTSLGVLPMKPGTTVEIDIEGVGRLCNTFGTVQSAPSSPET